MYPTQEGWVEYRNSANFRKIIERGNNLPRVMLTGQELNYNKNDRKLLLSLQLTEWSQTSYVWDFFGKKQGTEISGNNLMNEYAKGISDGKQALEYLPNSLCMHLMIETMDNKLIKSRISESKKNDNPGTWAFTLGEQLDPGDVRDDTNLHADFMQRWMRRAFLEEYKMNDNSYADIVDADSLRILSLDFESDRYNFALLCVVRLNYSYKTFSEKIYSTLDREEAREIGSLDLDEIPGILATYNTKDKNSRHTARGQYHPSSYLRLLMYYIHRKGIGRAEQEIEKYMREAK